MMITPQNKASKLAKAISLGTDLYLKREDLHKYKSHKGRSIPIMVEGYIKEKYTNFVISSSGNAALAAGLYITNYNKKNKLKLNLQIFVGKNINKNKLKILEKLTNKNIVIKQVERPKQFAFLLDKNGDAKFLRQSTDNTALIGYESLAKELVKIKNLSAVFIPTSSGTTAEGLYKSFKKLNLPAGRQGMNPQINIVQTSSCHPFVVGEFKKEKSIAGAIVDKIAHRKQNILKILEKSKGSGFVATNKQIKQVVKLVKQTENINISPNSALSIVSLIQAIENKQKFNGPVVCLITGK